MTGPFFYGWFHAEGVMRPDLIILPKPDVGRDLCLVDNCGFRCGAHLVFTDALGAFNDFQTPFNLSLIHI